MLSTLNATELRNNFSENLDIIARKNKPIIATRLRDNIVLLKYELLNEILSAYQLNASEFIEDDGSITLSLNELDLVSNGKDKSESISNLINDMREYAQEYYEDIENWYVGSRKQHYPYVLEILTATDDELRGRIICQAGKN